MAAFRLKSLTPRSLIGRTALILLVPIITIQLVVSYVFIQRLYENVTDQMTRSVVPTVELLLEWINAAESAEDAEADVHSLTRTLGVDLAFTGAEAVQDARTRFDLSGLVVTRVLRETLPTLGAVDLASEDNGVSLVLGTRHGPVVMGFDRSRVSARNPHQLLVLMVFVSTIVTIISFLFLKNQVRPIRRLAEAASAFGKGQIVTYRPGGATEVRQAGTSFLEMRDRIERHIEQRTLLLSGVSHDLRTPLTRMKLALSMLADRQEAEALERDVDEMQEMLDTFLGFARVDATEDTVETDPHKVAAEAVARSGPGVSLGPCEGEGLVSIRPMAIARSLDNLIGNALRYGNEARVSVAILDKSVRFVVEDNGPGIPEDRREEAIRPFARLDPARNQDKGGSVGLGLSIVRDIARQHGGALRLGESEDLGGLRVDLVVAR
ncbi:ATP-binding protein [Ovoidimarina sediminis]|uniref:ATP-binding protein n=1 Tax=Ovoidimarina sediminis TaxID=3079856 RepID=UPI00290C3E13|nr:ATP-binding protein [Rhodophyticola sp. MJ-SS7]MDU8946121.1 ATP-binding protein [Rhodophyticola sp. MJ-SS7]